jgi:hypothetical protein
MNFPFSVLVAGAGISGLMAARQLQAQNISVTLIDKGRGVGGRLATRRVEMENEGIALCDHGAQFFTVRETRFARIVHELIDAGLVKEWSRGFADLDGHYEADGHARYCGVRGMNSLAKHLAVGLKVYLSEKITCLEQNQNQWHIRAESGLELSADALILTPPVPQSLSLIDSGNFQLPEDIRQSLETITYDPCFAVLAVLDAPSAIPVPGALQLRGEPIAWIADNHRKGISPDVHCVTIHAGPEFTRQHWDTDYDTVAGKLLHAAGEWLRAPVKKYQVHRWRYSQPRQTHPERCVLVREPAPLVFAGDAFAEPRVEGAVLSGLAAAEALLNLKV